jgi:poly-gamma-glutamate synthesis protein (capsule biosynthesis protein)
MDPLSCLLTRRHFLEAAAIEAALAPWWRPQSSATRSGEVIISAVGDVTLGYHFPALFDRVRREWGTKAAFLFPFVRVRNWLASSDLCIANCEGTFTNCDKPRTKSYTFKAPPELARCLRAGGVSVVNLANNHFMDYGDAGASETIEACLAHGVVYTGGGLDRSDAESPRFFTRNGIRIAHIGCAQVGRSLAARTPGPGTHPCTERTYDIVKEAKQACDVVVVSCHWGVERTPYPTSEQRKAARCFIDAGASVVFGHHPHVLQGVEQYEHGVIFYSLGNFAFGGNRFPADRDSVIARVRCTARGVESFEMVPVITHPAHSVFQPYVPDDDVRARILAKLEERSTQLSPPRSA